jgi:hypothetical protein
MFLVHLRDWMDGRQMTMGKVDNGRLELQCLARICKAHWNWASDVVFADPKILYNPWTRSKRVSGMFSLISIGSLADQPPRQPSLQFAHHSTFARGYRLNSVRGLKRGLQGLRQICGFCSWCVDQKWEGLGQGVFAHPSIRSPIRHPSLSYDPSTTCRKRRPTSHRSGQ